MINHRPDTGRRRFAVACLLCVCCLSLLLTGCQTGPDGNWSFTMKNPFKSSKSLVERSKDSLSSLIAEKESDDPAAGFAQKMARARNMERSGKYEEARPIYERLIAEYPARYEPRHRLGVVADRQRRYREAQALYSEAIRLEPRDPDVFNDLGYCLFLQGKLEKAESALLKAVALSPANSRYRNNLGMVFGHQDRYEEALAEFRRAGSEADAYYNLAFVLATQEEVEDAKSCFRLALAADPTYSRARAALESFERYEEDPKGLADSGPVIENGIPWVPYVEGSESEGAGNVQPTSHTTQTNSAGMGPVARPSSQAQFRQARSESSRRMQAGME